MSNNKTCNVSWEILKSSDVSRINLHNTDFESFQLPFISFYMHVYLCSIQDSFEFLNIKYVLNGLFCFGGIFFFFKRLGHSSNFLKYLWFYLFFFFAIRPMIILKKNQQKTIFFLLSDPKKQRLTFRKLHWRKYLSALFSMLLKLYRSISK